MSKPCTDDNIHGRIGAGVTQRWSITVGGLEWMLRKWGIMSQDGYDRLVDRSLLEYFLGALRRERLAEAIYPIC